MDNNFKNAFVDIITKHGECFVNYLNGATLHYELIDNFLFEIYDYANDVFACCDILAENLCEWVDFNGIKSITKTNVL